MDINFNEIEKKRQKKRTSEQVYKASEDPDKKKFYVMDMFPYPS
jgi:leucyl-tRNA synthetase